MADTQHSVGQSVAVRRRIGRDPEKLKARRRSYYLRNKERCDARAAAARKPYGEWSPAKKERSKALKRKYRAASAAAAGRPMRPYVQAGHGKSNGYTWEQNAKQAWAWWLKTCPDWWMRAYHRAQGKPWNNPRISGAEKWRIRYWCDPVFRASQIEKVQTLKVRRAERIAANNDGTLTGDVIVSLFAAATHCAYCSSVMRSVQKSLDHVVALSKGGAHSITNVVVCCKTCNTKKGTKALTQSVSAQLIHGYASAEKT